LSAYHQNALNVGSTLAEYTIESVLGHGGFSVTYLAHDNALGAHVAIKEYLPQDVAARDGRTTFVVPRASKDAIRFYHWGLKNFVKEARALARFKHHNIVRVLRFIEANGTAYTVMEYEQGQTLAQYLKDKGQRLDETSLLRIVMPILNGLHAVHEVGLLHLDIKPENIYLRRDGSPMLIDFGSARHAMTENQPSGRVALTHGYAPVEQYPDKGKLGPWSDVYALGATMYRCVTGKRPDDALERYRAILDYKTDPVKPAAMAAAGRCQPVMLEGIDWAMQVHAKDRPQSPREFQDYLLGRAKRPRSGIAVSAAPSASARGMQRVGSRVTKFFARTTQAIVVLVLLVASGIGGWYAWPKIQSFWLTLYQHASKTDAPVLAAPSKPRPTSKPAPPRQAVASPSRLSERKSVSHEPVEAAPAPSALRAILPGHGDWVQAVAFAPRGHRLASASNDRTIRLWDVDSESPIAVLKQAYPSNAIAFAPDGRTLASAGADGAVHFWDVTNPGEIGRYDTTGYPLFSVAYAPNGRLLAAAGKDRSIYVWNLGDGVRRILEGNGGAVNALVFRPDGNSLVSAGVDRTIRIWDLEKNAEIASLPGHKDPILALALSADGRWLASGDAGNTIRLWDLRTLAHERTLTDVPQAVLSLAIAPDGSWIAAGSADGTVYVFDVKSGRLVQTLKGHEDFVQSVAVSHDGRLLASGGRDQAVRIWQSRVN
jgi:WD40 repeat protein/serine/threonine protein kinase